MVAQKTRISVERLSKGRGVRLRFLSRDDARDRIEFAGSAENEMSGDSPDELAREALLVSIALGQMQSYVELCERNDLRVEIYRDDALAELRGDGEHLHTRVLLRPRLAFRGADTPDARATAIRLLNEALGRSVFFDAPRIMIEMEPVFEFRDGSADPA